eukprot:Platyproteum_vivax@DN4007_c0_g1_i2.p1
MSDKAYNLLYDLDEVHISESMNVLEMVSDIEMNNHYSIKSFDGRTLFTAQEESTCCERNCCPKDCAPFRFSLYEGDTGFMGFDFTDKGPAIFQVERPCTCTFLCCCRPTIYINDEFGQALGSIVDPWALCNLTFRINDNDGEHIMSAKGGCCQCGILCPMPCGPCGEVNFAIEDSQSGDEIGEFSKVVNNCCKWCFSDADEYTLKFNRDLKPQHKVLLICLALFCDFRFFDDRNKRADDKDGE